MITFYSENLVDQAVITPSNENLLFPRENIKDPRRTKVFRSLTGSVELVFDFQETSEIDSILLVENHKTGFGFITATLDLAHSSNFTAPELTQELTFDVRSGVGLTELPEVQNYRFARLTLTSSIGYCELSKIFIGKKLILNGGIETAEGRGVNYGWTFKKKDLSQTKENRYGQVFGDVIARQRVFNVSFAALTKDHLNQIDSITDDKGIIKPFFIKIGCADMTGSIDRYTGMVRLSDIPQETNSHFNKFRLSMTLEEAM